VRYAVKRIDEIPGVPDPDPGGVTGRAMAVDSGTSVLVIAATSGKPYEVSAWDVKWTTGFQTA